MSDLIFFSLCHRESRDRFVSYRVTDNSIGTIKHDVTMIFRKILFPKPILRTLITFSYLQIKLFFIIRDISPYMYVDKIRFMSYGYGKAQSEMIQITADRRM